MAIPKPAGHYSPYVKANGFIFTAGQLPLTDSTTPPATVEEQTLLVLQKIEDILRAEGLDRRAIVKTTAFISHGDDWAAVNSAYREFFGEHRPARSIIPVAELHYGCRIEAEAIAAMPAP